MNETLGKMREWIQRNVLNGSTVTWGSDEVLRFNKSLTVKDFEELAMELQNNTENSPEPNGDKNIGKKGTILTVRTGSGYASNDDKYLGPYYGHTVTLVKHWEGDLYITNLKTNYIGDIGDYIRNGYLIVDLRNLEEN